MIRQLVTQRQISNLQPIEGADRIELATVDGWKVVVKKGEFKVGDRGVYFEIDSFLPKSDERFAFLMQKGSSREYNGTVGAILRTVRLRGQVSQGLILPLGLFSDEELAAESMQDALGIQKWEPPIPAELHGDVAGPLPKHLFPVTEQERVQNLSFDQVDELLKNEPDLIAEVKLDGTSMSVYHNNGVYGVCGRNWEFKPTTVNSLTRAADALNLKGRLAELGRNIALQGELVGYGINGNNEQLRGQEFVIFDIWLIDEMRYASFAEKIDTIFRLFGLEELEPIGELLQIHSRLVPVLVAEIDSSTNPSNFVERILNLANGVSRNPTVKREGLVFKTRDRRISFKAISNDYLLGEQALER